MHGSKTYLWYADHGARGTNFNLASHWAWISGKKIENNNIFFMEPLAAGEIFPWDNGFCRVPAGRSPRKNMHECKTAARIDKCNDCSSPTRDDTGAVLLCVKLGAD